MTGSGTSPVSPTTNPSDPEVDPSQDELSGKLETTTGFLHSYFSQLPEALNISRKDAVQMHRETEAGSSNRSVGYWLFLATACGIATLGLIINSPAVIIGAMLVSPLMGPILALGLGIAMTDIYLGLKGAMLVIVSVVVSILTAALITLLVPFKDATPEILGRTFPTLLDLFIALFCGIVAALSSVRSDGKAVLGSAAPGAAIGVALMPPLCVTGFGLATLNGSMVWGSILLFTTNLVAIVLTSSIFYYFIYEGYRFGKFIELLGKSRFKKERLFRRLSLMPGWQRLTQNINTRKRFLFPVILLLLIAFPLARSLQALKKKFDVRNYIAAELKDFSFLRGPESLTYTPDSVSGTLFFSSDTEPARDLGETLERDIARKFDGYRASLSLVRLARGADVSELRDDALTLQQGPEFEDATRDQHAREMARRAIERLHARFPRKAGLIHSVYLTYGAGGLRTVEIAYVGNELRGQSLALQTDTILRELQLWRPEVATVRLEYTGPLTGDLGCGARAKPDDALDFLRKRIAGPDRNPFLKIRVELADRLRTDPKQNAAELVPGLDGPGIQLQWKSESRCLLRYEYQ